MGDTTIGNFEVAGGSPAVRQVLANLWGEYTYPVEPAEVDAVLSGEDWPEVSVGFADEMQARIDEYLRTVDAADFPDRIEIVEDAAYEYHGDMHRWQPSLGWHHLTIDNSGAATIDPTWLRRLLDEARSVSSEAPVVLNFVEGEINTLLGKAWDPQWIVAKLITDAKPGERATDFMRAFHTREEAEAFCGHLPGAEDGLYVIDGPEDQ